MKKRGEKKLTVNPNDACSVESFGPIDVVSTLVISINYYFTYHIILLIILFHLLYLLG